MSSLEITAPPAMSNPPRPPRTWYFFGSSVVVLLAYAALNLGHFIAIVLELVRRGNPAMPQAELLRLAHDGGTLAWGTIAACPFVLAVLWAAIRIARRRFAEYLALRLPRRGELVPALAITLSFLLAWDLLSYLTGQVTPAYVINIYRTARDAGLLWLLLIAFCVAAPVTEEFAVRGALFRGWSQSFLGPIGAIILTSAIWAMMHWQYSWYYLLQVFCAGLMFGHFRNRSGSTWLTVAMHGVFNLAVLAQTALKVAYF